jgi:hypothetical protein
MAASYHELHLRARTPLPRAIAIASSSPTAAPISCELVMPWSG